MLLYLYAFISLPACSFIYVFIRLSSYSFIRFTQGTHRLYLELYCLPLHHTVNNYQYSNHDYNSHDHSGRS